MRSTSSTKASTSLVRGAEVDDAGTDVDLPVDPGVGGPEVAALLQPPDDLRVVGVEVGDVLTDVAERHDRELRLARERLEHGARDDRVVQQPRLGEVPSNRGAEGLGAVDTERQPELQRPEGPRVLERDVGRVQLLTVVREVLALVAERAMEILLARGRARCRRPSGDRATCGRRSRRVGALEAAEEMRCRRDARRGQPVGAVDVEPDVLARRRRRRVRRSGRRRR